MGASSRSTWTSAAERSARQPNIQQENKMKRITMLLLGFALLAFGPLDALAQAKKGTAAEATAMVEKAVAHIKKAGKDKAFADFNNKTGAFTDRDLYVVVYDLKGNVLSHGANDKMIGKNVIDLRDNDG